MLSPLTWQRATRRVPIGAVALSRGQVHGNPREAIRLDLIEAPRREAEQRRKEATNASAARDKTRIANKAAFRP